MVASFVRVQMAARAADLRKVAAQAAIEWQAAHFAGCSPDVVQHYEQQYLLLVQKARLLETEAEGVR